MYSNSAEDKGSAEPGGNRIEAEMGKRNLYLNNTPVEEAKALYQKALGELLRPKAEWIPVTESLHRITKEAVYAKYCSPLYNAAAMDGIAVEAEKTKGASERKPLTLYPGTDFTVVDTGDPIHAPCDAVIMAEDLLEQEDGSVQITDAAAYGSMCARSEKIS